MEEDEIQVCLNGVDYRALNGPTCRGCAFDPDKTGDTLNCDSAVRKIDCSVYNIIWVKKEDQQVANETKPEQKATDIQEGGNHYKEMKFQPVEYIHGNNLNFFEGNVVKYVTRHKSKNGAEDIKKAIHYLNLILQFEYGQ